ncbi:MAG: hypothetical protein GWO02_09555 [Gammaproteobacteria bacterium]|nr:hypothetical protein [Gammaproteobacteria bacterium]
MFGRVERGFRALAETFVPELADAGHEDWTRLMEIVGVALRQRPPSIERQLVLLVRVLDWMPLVTRGRRFAALSPDQRCRLLERWQDSRWLALRRGVWGLRTVVFMGYYSRPTVHRRLGYRAHREGWSAVRARREAS